MKKNEHIALIVLALMGAGFLASLSYIDTLVGGLCAAATLAGLIGGLADWFAVSAIFGKPLGVSFKTNLIVSNRDRLSAGVGRMVSEELLAPEAIEAFLGKKNLGAMVSVLFDRLDGKRYLKQYLVYLARLVLAELDTKALLAIVRGSVRAGLRSADWRAEAADGIRYLAQSGHLDEAGRVVLTEVRRIASSEEMHAILVKISADALSAYESGAMGRQFVSQMANISPERCAEMVEDKMMTFLAEEERAHRGAMWLSRALVMASEHIDMEAAISAAADAAEDKVSAWLIDTRRALDEAPESVAWLDRLAKAVQGEVDALLLDDEKNRAFNKWARSVICEWLTSHQNELADLAKRGVDRLPDEHLTGFLKEKVGHDLQMIRVNGSLVGALAGAALYLLRYAWKAVVL